MKYSSRFFLYAPLALFLALAAWAMGYWWVVAGALDKKLTALNGHEAIPGVTIAYTSKTISGFPFNIDVVFTGFKLSGAGAHGPFAWQTDHFALHRLTYGRAQDIYEAAGSQSFSWTGGDGKSHALKFLPGSLRASAITDAAELARFDLDIIDAAGTNEDGKTFAIGRGQLHLRRDPKRTDALELMARADAVKAPTFQVQSVQAYVTLTRRAALAPLLAGVQGWPEADAAWRKAGGTAEARADGILSAVLNALY